MRVDRYFRASRLTGFAVLLMLVISCRLLASDSTRTFLHDEMIITGTRIAMDKSRIPMSISTVHRNEIERSHSINILPVLGSSIPGLFLAERNPAGFGVGPRSSGKMSMRGAGGNPTTDILVLIDGQPQFMGLFGHPISDAYMSEDIEKVEVIRGAASLLYGSGAMGGAINLITRRSDSAGVSAAAGIQYGSFDTRNYSASAGYAYGRFNSFVSFSRSESDGHRKNADDSFRSNNGFARLSYPVSDYLTVSADGNISDSRIYDPGPEYDLRKNNYYDYLRGRAALSFSNRSDYLEGSLRVFHSWGSHDFYDGWHSDDNVTGISLYQNYRFSSKDVFAATNVITVGVDHKNYGGEGSTSNAGVQGLNKKYSVRETDVYGLIRYDLSSELTADAGMRITVNSEYGNETVPHAGLSWLIDPYTILKLNAGKAFRSPTVVDMFIYPVSNDELKPEEAWNFDLGISKSLFANRLSGELTVYYIEGRNMIETVASLRKKMNSGSFRNRGTEVSVRYNPMNALSFIMNYAYLRSDRILPFAPAQQMNLECRYSVGILNLSVQLKKVQGLNLFTQDNRFTRSQNFTVLSAAMEAALNRNIQLNIQGENLTGLGYYIEDGYPMPRAAFSAGIRFRY